MTDVSMARFMEAYDEDPTTIVIDVRQPAEYVAGHVPGAVLVPMGQLPSRMAQFDRARPVHLICATGNRSSAMAAFLTGMGMTAYSVDGGTQAWVAAGRDVVTGSEPVAA